MGESPLANQALMTEFALWKYVHQMYIPHLHNSNFNVEGTENHNIHL